MKTEKIIEAIEKHGRQMSLEVFMEETGYGRDYAVKMMKEYGIGIGDPEAIRLQFGYGRRYIKKLIRDGLVEKLPDGTYKILKRNWTKRQPKAPKTV